MKKYHGMKKTISVRQFISEFGESFSDYMKERILELESRCFFTRKEISYRLDLKHVEHLQYNCDNDSEVGISTSKKEYVYGQFAVMDGLLYFSECCVESDDLMQSPRVSDIYNSLSSEGMIVDEGTNLKKVDDNNIDYVIDNILASCPQVSQSYINIIEGMKSRSSKR